MKRYRLTGMLDPSSLVPDPDGRIVLWADVERLLSDPVTGALADYASKLDAWDADTTPRVHAFKDAGLADGLAAAIRAERRKVEQS